MSESDGELKKRIHGVFDPNPNWKSPMKEWLGDSTLVSQGDIFRILDAAAKEYPCLQLPHKPEQYVADVFIKLTLERDEWFKKWFGEQKSTSNQSL